MYCKLGRLGQDIELKTGKSEKGDFTFLNNTLFVNENFSDDDIPMSIIAYNATARFMAEHLKKGDAVYAEGYFKENKWKKDGENRSKLVWVIKQVSLPGKSTTAIEQAVSQDYNDDYPSFLRD